MIRTQVSLSVDEYRAAKREARRLGVSLAELLRRSIQTMLSVGWEKPWMKYAGIVESADANASRRIDETVYDQRD